MKKLSFLFLMIIVISCSKDETKDIELSSVKINEYNTTLTVGDIATFTLSYLPSEAIKPPIEWETSPVYIAKIDSNGVLKAISDGDVKVKVSTKTFPALQDEITVTILPLAPDSISIDQDANVYYGGSKCFSVKFYPENSKSEIIWSSSNESIATISKQGCLSIKGIGSVTITAKAPNINQASTCRVSINHRNPNKQAVQCVAITKAGKRCKRMTTNLNARCWQH